jgi:ERCC4-type nuclease
VSATRATRDAALGVRHYWIVDIDARTVECFEADQAASIGTRVLRRSDRKPKRTTSRRLHLLQGLPGIGPALANRLLLQLGSIERVVRADEPTLMEVRGLGRIKAARIRELVRSSA